MSIPEVAERKHKTKIRVIFADEIVFSCPLDAVLQNYYKRKRGSFGVNTHANGAADIVNGCPVYDEIGFVIIKTCLEKRSFV